MKIKIILSLIVLICFSQHSFAQKSNKKADKKITITGMVVDTLNNPVENAVIFIDKVKTSSVTNHQGFFKVQASPKAREILVFTLLNGFSREEINGRTTINFVLAGELKNPREKVNVNESEDEIVNTGYGTMKRKDATTQIGKIDGENAKFASYQNIYDMIRGRVPGVEVSGNSIKIMGSSSLNISTEPLFVVDGVIVSSIDDISPQTVKSIEVLKGAAASVYGAKGSNGVILITRFTGKD